MGIESLSGRQAAVYQATRGTLVEGDALAALNANTWYEIESVAPSGSVLPIGEVSAVFKTPDTTETAITPAVGDNVYPLTLTNVCKTDAEVNVEEGTIDVTDDCEGGYNAMILDGFATISGTLGGFLKFDDETGEVQGVEFFLNRFFNVVTDDGAGTYTVSARENDKILLFIQLNRGAEVGDIQNFIIVPVLFSSLATGAGLKDAQKRDLAWTKAQGYVSLYKRTAFAADVI